MIYLFRIISDENQDFCRDLVIKGSDTFLDFHQVLQKDLGFDPSQLASFFITNELWEKEQEITLMDMNQDPEIPAVTMDQVTIEEHITEVEQRMIYVFDFFSERSFFIELLEISNQTSRKNTPFIGHACGDAPAQESLDKLMDDAEPSAEDIEMKEDMDDLRIDDLDPDLFDTGFPEDF